MRYPNVTDPEPSRNELLGPVSNSPRSTTAHVRTPVLQRTGKKPETPAGWGRLRKDLVEVNLVIRESTICAVDPCGRFVSASMALNREHRSAANACRPTPFPK